MGFKHKVLAVSYPAMLCTRGLAKLTGLDLRPRLRVLLYHDIAPDEIEKFSHQLLWLSKRWNFVSPEQFESMVRGDELLQGDNLLLTFDDGFASNRIVAEKILNPMGIHALFFVVPDFVEIDEPELAQQFISKNIIPGLSTERILSHWNNLNWTDLEMLLEQGHSIGCHTQTHARLSSVLSQADLKDEIINSADILERHLGIRIDHFAYTFGDLASFSLEALKIASQRFRFIYSGLRGNNATGISPLAIRRDAIKANDSVNLLGSFLEGSADPQYRSQTQILDSWICSLNN